MMDRPSLSFGFRDSTHDGDGAQGHDHDDQRREDYFIEHDKSTWSNCDATAETQGRRALSPNTLGIGAVKVALNAKIDGAQTVEL